MSTLPVKASLEPPLIWRSPAPSLSRVVVLAPRLRPLKATPLELAVAEMRKRATSPPRVMVGLPLPVKLNRELPVAAVRLATMPLMVLLPLTAKAALPVPV